MSNQDCWPISPPLQKLLQGRRGLPSGYRGVVCQHLQHAAIPSQLPRTFRKDAENLTLVPNRSALKKE